MAWESTRVSTTATSVSTTTVTSPFIPADRTLGGILYSPTFLVVAAAALVAGGIIGYALSRRKK